MRPGRYFAELKWGLLGILGLVVLLPLGAAYYKSVRMAKRTHSRVMIANIHAATTNYFAIYGAWPASLRDLTTPNNPRRIVFLHENTNDAWNHPIIFNRFNAELGYGSVITYGRDGKPGGHGDDADIELHFGK